MVGLAYGRIDAFHDQSSSNLGISREQVASRSTMQMCRLPHDSGAYWGIQGVLGTTASFGPVGVRRACTVSATAPDSLMMLRTVMSRCVRKHPNEMGRRCGNTSVRFKGCKESRWKPNLSQASLRSDRCDDGASTRKSFAPSKRCRIDLEKGSII